MRAVRIHETGGPDVLRVEDVAAPAPAGGEALVRIEYAGLNFIDTYKRSGLYKVPLPSTLGEEGAGVVEAVGPDVTDVRVGDRVAWASVMGAYAEYAVVKASRLVPVPANVDTRVAAAVMLQGMTAHYLATSTFPLERGQSCLVHAAAGGVGLLLCQLGRQRGAHVIATASTADKQARAGAAGAEHAVSYAEFGAAAKRLTGGRGVQVVYDSVGQSTFHASLDALAPRGMMVSFGQSSGPVGPIDPLLLSRKGSLFLTRPTLAHYVQTREELVARTAEVFRWVVEGTIDVHIDRIVPLAAAAEAHRALESRQTSGKVLLTPAS